MCTIVVFNEHFKTHPLVVIFNRDESLDRPSQTPELRKDPVAHIAGKDLLSGGTWAGVTDCGWFVAVTNQDDGHHIDEAPSRGLVVRDLLLMKSHSDVAVYLSKLDVDAYNPFNLVFGRPGAMFLCRVHHDLKLEFEPLEPGIYAFSNDHSTTGNYNRKLERAWSGAFLSEPSDNVEAELDYMLRESVLNNHEGSCASPHQAICVHDDKNRFGTQSSGAVTVSIDGDVKYYHSEGPACRSSGFKLVHGF